MTRTSGERCTGTTEVWLIDTRGELQSIYSAADVAFVGGSLVPVGGHNLLEPAALGVAVIAGSHLHNTEDIANLLSENGALRIVSSAEQLADELVVLLGDPARRAAMTRVALDIVQENRGAVDRLISLIDPILAPQVGAAKAGDASASASG